MAFWASGLFSIIETFSDLSNSLDNLIGWKQIKVIHIVRQMRNRWIEMKIVGLVQLFLQRLFAISSTNILIYHMIRPVFNFIFSLASQWKSEVENSKKTSTACFRRLARRLKDHQPKHDVYIEKLWNDDLFIGKFRPGSTDDRPVWFWWQPSRSSQWIPDKVRPQRPWPNRFLVFLNRHKLQK